MGLRGVHTPGPGVAGGNSPYLARRGLGRSGFKHLGGLMRRFWLVIAVLALAGCKGEEDSEGSSEEPGAALVGTWSLDVSGGCYRLMAFVETGEYRTLGVCGSGNQAFGQYAAGTWAVGGPTLTTAITDFMGCEDSGSGPMTGTWAVKGTEGTRSLVLDTPQEVITYQWMGDDSTPTNYSGVLRKGCFTDEGFTPFQ